MKTEANRLRVLELSTRNVAKMLEDSATYSDAHDILVSIADELNTAAIAAEQPADADPSGWDVAAWMLRRFHEHYSSADGTRQFVTWFDDNGLIQETEGADWREAVTKAMAAEGSAV